MTEEIPATPSWVEQRLDSIFAGLPAETKGARDNYLTCIARGKAPAAPSDLLGAEFAGCRTSLRQNLLAAGFDHATLHRIDQELEALEAEFTADS